MKPASSRPAFTLIELLVCISIISLLVAILLPALARARVAARTVACMSNLKSLGGMTHVRVTDYDGYLPGDAFSYNGTTGSFPYTGPRDIANPSEWNGWYQRANLGQYLFPAGTSDYQNHEVYACLSAPRPNQVAGKSAFTYWVNSFAGADGKAPWVHNGALNDVNKPVAKWTLLDNVTNPSDTASIYDCAQNENGKVASSGGGGWITTILTSPPNDNPAPRPHHNSDPNLVLASKNPAFRTYDNYSARGGIDFRHPNETLNAVMFDGHVRTLANGSVLNKNFIYRFD